ncbi:MAG: lysylphosphatidylglycerol synthase transmembrane domain-containing protein [Acidimicrobiia bacterium]
MTVRWTGPRWARPLWGLLAAFSVVRVVSGTNLPLDLVVAYGTGLAAGSGALLAVGSPDLAPGGAAVVEALRRNGLAVVSLTERPPAAGASRSYRARLAAGSEPPEVDVDVHSDNDRDRDLVARLYQRIRSRTASAAGAFLPVELVAERAAFVALWLDRLGVRAGRPVAVARAGRGAALVAHEPVAGTSLADLGADAPHAALVAAWRAAGGLHAGRVAHGALDTRALTIDGDGRAWVRDLAGAVLDAPEPLLLVDRATLLVSTALQVGPEAAVAACREALGDDALTAALPYVQVPALPLSTRLRLRGSERTLRAVRDEARRVTGAGEVELVRLARVQRSTVLLLVAGVVVLTVLLPQLTTLADAGRAMADADWPWLLPVAVLMPLWYVTSTVTFRAATPLRPPFGLTYLTQLAAATLNRVTPNNVGGLGTNIRFLQRSGYGATEAATTLALVTLANGIAGVAVIAVFVTWAGQSDARLPWPGRSELLVVAGVALGLAGLVAAVPALRRLVGGRVGPVVRRAGSSLAELATDPRRGATMLLSSVAGSAIQLACLWFVLRAFGASVGVAVMGAVLFGGKAVAGAAPTPGGLGAVEATLIGGLSGAGVDPAVATPAVLVFRLLTNWAVVVPGWWSLRLLRRRHVL